MSEYSQDIYYRKRIIFQTCYPETNLQSLGSQGWAGLSANPQKSLRHSGHQVKSFKNESFLIVGQKTMAHTSSNSSSSAKYSVGRIKNIIKGFKSVQNRGLTVANYQNIWRHCNKFILSLDVIPKLWEERASLFAAHLVHEGVQSSTLKSYISAIKINIDDRRVSMERRNCST